MILKKKVPRGWCAPTRGSIRVVYYFNIQIHSLKLLSQSIKAKFYMKHLREMGGGYVNIPAKMAAMPIYCKTIQNPLRNRRTGLIRKIEKKCLERHAYPRLIAPPNPPPPNPDMLSPNQREHPIHLINLHLHKALPTVIVEECSRMTDLF